MTRLLNQRKYIFAVHEVTTRLAYIGVLQFGPQKLKEKDQVKSFLFVAYHLNILPHQVFLYLNRKSSIVDTTSSCPGYHQAGEIFLPNIYTFLFFHGSKLSTF